MRYKLIFPLLLLSLLYACDTKRDAQRSIIPRPSIAYPDDDICFAINDKTKFILQTDDSAILAVVDSFAFWINQKSGFNLSKEKLNDQKDMANSILISTFQADTAIGQEGYKLRVSPEQVTIQATSYQGVFYAIQSLKQMTPPEVFSNNSKEIEWPTTYIIDKPYYQWRGMHLDVSRHFFPVSFIKKFIDMLAFYKMNTFHWHLTDDNGWRIEIKSYPDLTKKAAWHVDRNHEKWNNPTPPKKGEKATVGGFYTQEEVREVVRYATSRCITIIPEIEMPGHSSEVFNAYPNLSCKGDTLPVQPATYWPNIDILCAGNEEVFSFIDSVLTEVAALFPAPYIHIGGDEADKTRWKECNQCQQRIKKEKLNDESELQSWFIHRVEKIVHSKGKRMIGWDEILEGGLAPDATVMVWRNMDAGVASIKAGHDVIMTPTSHCYFDYYQADPDFEPEAIGGFNSLKNVYNFNPTPPGLSKEEEKHILGTQGNLWSEFLPNEKQVEYMAFPRLLAIAEVGWTKPSRKDYQSFIKRVEQHKLLLGAMGVNIGNISAKVDILLTQDSTSGLYYVSMQSDRYNPIIRYTLDGSVPTSSSQAYEQPFKLENNAMISAAIFENDRLVEKPSKRQITFHKATGAITTLDSSAHYKYSARGALSLTDGIFGSINFNDGQWLGFEGYDVGINLDLKQKKELKTLEIHFINDPKAWILLPKRITLYSSNDGKKYSLVKSSNQFNPVNNTTTELVPFKLDFPQLKSQFIRIVIESAGVLPDDHPFKGEKAWLFLDEIILN